MNDISIINKYFPSLSDIQKEQFSRLGELYPEWNEKINVISRKDIDNLYINHILHSLAIAKFWGNLAPGTSILDMGTGGGLPGIPLAIMYPQCRFHLIDRIGKKIRVANEIAASVGLENITFQHGDIGECRKEYTYVVSRAVMALDMLVRLTAKNVDKKSTLPNLYRPGIVCLKGGDIADECGNINHPVIEYPVCEFFNEEFFSTKKIVYVPFA